MLKVSMDDLETSEYDYFLDVTYNGEPFTGIAFESTNRYYSEYSFLNGKGHGKCFSRYTNGQLMEEIELCEGEHLYDITWYETGVMESRATKNKVEQWFPTGIICYEEDFGESWRKEYYSTGVLKKHAQNKKNERIENATICYTMNGVWVFRPHSADGLNENCFQFQDGTCWFEYNYDALSFELSSKEWEYGFLKYYSELIRYYLVHNPQFALLITSKLLTHNDARAKDFAITLSAGMSLKEMIPFLEEALSDNRIPESYTFSYDSHTSVSWTKTISERAKSVLDEWDRS